MKIRIIAVGKLKESYWREAAAEYIKRLSPFAAADITEVGEGRGSVSEILREEGRRILPILKGYTVLLDIKGEAMSSEKFADFVAARQISGVSEITFVIGGSHGVCRELVDNADFRLSFSEFTFPHQMMRVILLEQTYRAFMINAGREYHK